MKVRVNEIDALAGQIAVQYSLSDEQKTMNQYGCDQGKALFLASQTIAISSTAVSRTVTATTINITTTVTINTRAISGSTAIKKTDSDVLLNCTVAASSEGSRISSPTAAIVHAASKAIESAVASVVSDDSIMVTRWVDLHSEDNCDLYTHTVRPKSSYGKGFSSSSGYGYSNGSG